MQRFKEPVHVFEGSRSDDMRCGSLAKRQCSKNEDIESSAEVTLDAGLTQLSEHEKNRCLLRHESVGPFGGNSCSVRGPAGTISGTVLGTAGFPQLEASRILKVLRAVRWPRG